MVIYSNLGESGKAVGTKLVLHRTLKGGEISYMEKRAFYPERLVNKIGKLLGGTSCRRILCNSKVPWEISTSQLLPPVVHHQRVAKPSRNYESFSFWGQYQTSGDLPKLYGI